MLHHFTATISKVCMETQDPFSETPVSPNFSLYLPQKGQACLLHRFFYFVAISVSRFSKPSPVSQPAVFLTHLAVFLKVHP